MPSVVEVMVSRPDNPGLAEAYRGAADLFSAKGVEWMVLLDQDTVVTREYLDEVVAVASGEEAVPPSVAVLVPPRRRGPTALPPRAGPAPASSLVHRPGVVLGFSTHLNSGSVLRLSAVRRVGGFPDGYPLDYLDHAVHPPAGGRWPHLAPPVHPRAPALPPRPATLGTDRLASILEAEHRYHVEFGTRADLAGSPPARGPARRCRRPASDLLLTPGSSDERR